MHEGATLGPYEIVRQLGAGGMGEVYLARDTRLGREVAIKVLPAGFAADPERLARFEQEARAAAALDHPNIAAVHDVGVGQEPESGQPIHYMVQEYLRGTTLEDAVDGPRWPLAKILAVSTEIAEALAAAHAAGVVHRDLKPANVFVTEQGHAKVLDFGLAKLTEPAFASGDSSLTAVDQSPTVLGTMAGQIMGTAGYMAPEQIEGGVVDGRADVFAFGCLLYEIADGRRPFSGRSMLQTLDLILHEDPEPLASGPTAPAELQWILDKCLAKDVALRYQSAADLVVDLKRLAARAAAGRLAGSAVETPAGSADADGPSRRTVPLAVAAALVLAAALATAGASAWFGSSADTVSPPVRRFEVRLPEGLGLTSVGRPVVAMSPDGRRVAITANNQIFLRGLDEADFEPVRGTEDGGRAAVFSPDGEEIVFWRDGELLRLPLGGVVPLMVAASENPWGIRWQSDDTLLYGQGEGGIWRVSASGGAPELIYDPPEGELAHGPQMIAGGEWLLMTLAARGGSWEEGRVVAWSPRTLETILLVPRGRDARLLPTGHLVYAQENTVLAQRFVADPPSLQGAPVAVLEHVLAARNLTATAHFSVADDGTLVHAVGDGVRAVGSEHLAWLDLNRNLEPTVMPDLRMQDFRVSAQNRVAVVTRPDNELMIFDLGSGVGQRVQSHGASYPVWSADGRWLYYARDSGAQRHIYRQRADASAPAELVLGGEQRLAPADIAADGSFLIVERQLDDGNLDLLRYGFDGDLEPLADSSNTEAGARLSSDQRYLAYERSDPLVARESQIIVLDLETGARKVVSALEHEATRPRWREDGRVLYYAAQFYDRSDTLNSVAISTDGGLTTGRPEPLLSLDPSMMVSTDINLFEVRGDRFLVPSSFEIALSDDEEPTSDNQLVFVTSWFEDVRRRLEGR